MFVDREAAALNPLCTPAHAARLKALHDRDPNFGVIGHLWADQVATLVQETRSTSLLDYGCGRSNLVPEVVARLHKAGYSLQERREYDPAFGHALPDPADFVTAIDVLEHVEADLLLDVMRDIRRCFRKRALVTISLRNASPKKRAVHPNVYPREWWTTAVLNWIGIPEEIPILDPFKADSEIALLVRPYEEVDL